jgi:uncharacterized protein YndB with AHSA1/START domain
MLSLEISRTLAAPPERVWRALTQPEALGSWFWPAAFGTTVEVDLRVGGRFRIAAPNGPAGGFAAIGEYVTVEPPHRLVFRWGWEGEPDEETLVTVTLNGDGDKTELLLVHERFATETDRDNHRQGWTDCLDRLPAHLAR